MIPYTVRDTNDLCGDGLGEMGTELGLIFFRFLAFCNNDDSFENWFDGDAAGVARCVATAGLSPDVGAP